MTLPFEDNHFDAAVMALVLFFVPDPAKGVAEMARVVRPGGAVTAYLWHPAAAPATPFRVELHELGVTIARPVSAETTQMPALGGLWTGAGLEVVETREIEIRRTFADFGDLWDSTMGISQVEGAVAQLSSGDVEQLKARLRARLPTDAQGRITYAARANAIKGRVPKAN